MESQQLLTQGQVFQDKVRSGAKDRKYPAEQMYQTPKHDRILAECAPWTQAPKSLILRMYGIMASHNDLRRPRMRRIWCQLGTQVKLSILPFSTARHLGHGAVWLGTVFWPQAARGGPRRRLLRAAYERTSHPSATDSDVRVALYKIHRAIRAGLVAAPQWL